MEVTLAFGLAPPSMQCPHKLPALAAIHLHLRTEPTTATSDSSPSRILDTLSLRKAKSKAQKKSKNIQQRVFASGHPPNY
jgi:hypothetical protein